MVAVKVGLLHSVPRGWAGRGFACPQFQPHAGIEVVASRAEEHSAGAADQETAAQPVESRQRGDARCRPDRAGRVLDDVRRGQGRAVRCQFTEALVVLVTRSTGAGLDGARSA